MEQKTVVKARLTGIAESHSLTLLKVRDLVDVSDEPEIRGGTNEGFAPTEMFLGSLAACSNVITHKIAKKHSIEIDSLEIGVDAEFNRLGVTLTEEIDLPFPRIQLEFKVSSPQGEEGVEILKTELPKFCPVAKMIEGAGTEIVSTWIVN